MTFWIEARAGVHAGILASAQTLTHGMIAFAAFGAAGIAFGMAAGLVASALASLSISLFGGSRPLIGNTSAAMALVSAGLISAAQPTSFGHAVALAMLLAVGAGIIMLVLVATRLGRLAAMMPTPVVQGLGNAIAVLVVLNQVPLMLGASPGEAAPWRAPVPGALAVFAIALLLMTRRPLLRVPTPLLALAAAGALQQLLARAGVATGPGIGFAPTPETLFAGIAGALAMPPPPLDVGLLLPAALSLALLATIESTTAVAALREVSGRRGDHDRDLRGAAIGMIGGGVAGGMPVGCMPLASIACWRAGGRGRAAQVWRAAVPLVLLTLAGTLVAELPFAALSGVLCGAVARLIQIPALPFAAGPGRFRRLGDLLVVLSVLVVAVAFGLVAAVGAGVLLAVLIFTASMATSPVRRTSRNPIGRSRIRRPEEEERALRRAGDAIALIELEGPIFFGSAERVLLRAEAEAAAGARVLILDLSRVTRMDLSGGRRLIEVCGVLPGRVLLAPLHPSSRAAAEIAALGLVTQIPSGAAYDDLPSAVEVAEELVFSDIAAARPAPAGTHRAALEALGMPPSVVGPLLALSKEVHFADGQLILRKGEPSDAAYLLLAGRVLISLPAGDARPATRLAVLAPGVIFGESALLGQMRRSADVVARGDVRCLRIDAAAAERLRAEAPAIAWHLMAVVAAQLAAQVRAANAIIDRLEA